MNSREYDYLFKLVIIGNSGVGKSSILLRLSDDQFNDNYITTIGVDFRFKTFMVDGKRVKLQIWDTAGQERFRTITNAYYKGADGVVIAYDTTNQQSFDDIEKFWMNEVESYADKQVDIVLLGNKSDLANEKVVNTEQTQEYADRRKMNFFETSAKTSEQVENSFLQLTKRLIARKTELLIERKKQRRESRKSYKEGQRDSSPSFDQQKKNTGKSESTKDAQPTINEQINTQSSTQNGGVSLSQQKDKIKQQLKKYQCCSN